MRMAAFCRFWRISPSEYWSLSVAETAAMTEYAQEELAARERAAKRR